MVENQPIRCTTSSGLQPRTTTATRAARAAAGARGLGTTDLLGARRAQQRFDLSRPRRLGRDEDAELVVREPWVVGHGPQTPRREQCVEQDAENGREGAEQDRHLE